MARDGTHKVNRVLSQGDTLEEAVANSQEAKIAWIETAWECNDEIPLPKT
ncbi:type II toxin-antitoxin system HicB family antitoxin [Spirulina major CS-329]|nr:type II toxin-antitoxin system HicB family antitoxin [Spirulina subsalsa]MDB9494584.1 type II toxin-antitoxin system HicB family antitoxin [Spirulina subsalsa CS-330]MDB9504834.1 type II toxin-antitoxin system HicB family antitoxin [Spirulina major CS-329]